MELYTYYMNGCYLTESEYIEFKRLKDNGMCPFCNNPYSNKYGALNKHINSCQSRNELKVERDTVMNVKGHESMLNWNHDILQHKVAYDRGNEKIHILKNPSISTMVDIPLWGVEKFVGFVSDNGNLYIVDSPYEYGSGEQLTDIAIMHEDIEPLLNINTNLGFPIRSPWSSENKTSFIIGSETYGFGQQSKEYIVKTLSKCKATGWDYEYTLKQYLNHIKEYGEEYWE
jgi:hypothetical protein